MAVSPASQRTPAALGAAAGVGSAEGVTAGAQAAPTVSTARNNRIPGEEMARIADAPEDGRQLATWGSGRREGACRAGDPPAGAQGCHLRPSPPAGRPRRLAQQDRTAPPRTGSAGMKKILFLAATAATLVAVLAGCRGGHNGQPTPASTPAMDSAMTAVHDSGSRPDSTVSDTTR